MRNLLGRLLQRSQSDLEHIAEFWGVELRGMDRHADVSTLYRTITDIWAFRDTWERLSRTGRELIVAMERGDGTSATADEWASRTVVSLAQTERLLADLFEIGLVSTEEDDDPDLPRTVRYFLPREVGMLVERIAVELSSPSRVQMSLEQLLGTLPLIDIEDAASAWGTRIIPAMHARGDLVAILSGHLSQASQIRSHLDSLSGPARNAWLRLRNADGAEPIDRLLSPDDVSLLTRRKILRELATSLLLWHEYRNGERYVFIPDVILNPPPLPTRALPDLAKVAADDVEQPDPAFPYSAAWDLLMFMRLVDRHHPRWKALAEADFALVRRVASSLWGADEESQALPTGYVELLIALAARAGLLQEASGSRAALGEQAQRWRESAFSTATARLVEVWTDAEFWLEGMQRLDLDLYGVAWPRIRKHLLTALKELSPDTWYARDPFVKRLLARNVNLVRDLSVASVATETESADRRSGIMELVLITTLETAGVWLGLVEMSQVRADGQPVFRLTRFGAWYLGLAPEPMLPALGNAALAVGGDFQVLLFRPTPRRVWSLSAFAELKTLDRVSSWTLTAQALTGALATGVNLEQVVTYLENAAGQPLPQNVAATMADWDLGYRRVWMRHAVVFVPEDGESPEPMAAALLEAGLETETLADGRLLLIYDEQDAGERLFTAASRALHKQGFAPLTELSRRQRMRAMRSPDSDS